MPVKKRKENRGEVLFIYKTFLKIRRKHMKLKLWNNEKDLLSI